jgi:hypothetical protein
MSKTEGNRCQAGGAIAKGFGHIDDLAVRVLLVLVRAFLRRLVHVFELHQG